MSECLVNRHKYHISSLSVATHVLYLGDVSLFLGLLYDSAGTLAWKRYSIKGTSSPPAA